MKIMYEHMPQNAESAKYTLWEDKFEIFQRVRPGKKCVAPCFQQAGVVFSPFICFKAFGKS